MKKIFLVFLISIIVITNTQAMSNYPSTLVLEGNTNEWLNETVHFSDVPTKTLTGYEKWTLDGKTLNRSLKAEDVGIELNYPKVVEIENGSAIVDIAVRAKKCGSFVGAVFYRTEGQSGIAAGTWIKINVTEKSVDLVLPQDVYQQPIIEPTIEPIVLNNTKEKELKGFKQYMQYIWKRFFRWIAGFFLIAGASSVMNVSVNITTPTVTATPYKSSGGGGGGSSRDSDGDGYSDWYEIIHNTDPTDPNDYPHKATLTPIPTSTPIPEVVIPTPTPKVAPTPAFVQPIIQLPKKKIPWVPIGIIVGGIVSLMVYLLCRREVEYEYSEEEGEEDDEDDE